MKSQYNASKITTSWTKGTNTNQYRPNPTTQSNRVSAPATNQNKSSYVPVYASNTSSSYISKYEPKKYQPQSNYQPERVIITSNSGNKSSINLPPEPKWQNSRADRRTGNTETRVETKQQGDYIIKVTTTRKVIDKGSPAYEEYKGNKRGNYGRKG